MSIKHQDKTSGIRSGIRKNRSNGHQASNILVGSRWVVERGMAWMESKRQGGFVSAMFTKATTDK
jgi:hypothetical protein